MAIPSRQIGWSQESNLIWEVLRQLNQLTNVTSKAGGGGYKVYTALLTSNGAADPTPTVLENTLGSDVIWRREQEGVYYGENINFTDPSKVFIIITPNNSAFGNGNIVYTGSDVYDNGAGNVVYFSTRFLGGGLTDSWGTYIPIEIRVYP